MNDQQKVTTLIARGRTLQQAADALGLPISYVTRLGQCVQRPKARDLYPARDLARQISLSLDGPPRCLYCFNVKKRHNGEWLATCGEESCVTQAVNDGNRDRKNDDEACPQCGEPRGKRHANGGRMKTCGREVCVKAQMAKGRRPMPEAPDCRYCKVRKVRRGHRQWNKTCGEAECIAIAISGQAKKGLTA